MSEINYDSVRERVERGVKQQKMATRWAMFAVNILMFVIFMGIAWGASLSNPEFMALANAEDSPLMLALIMPTIGWLMGIMMHVIGIGVDSGMGEKEIRGRVAAREIAQEMLESGMSNLDKPKRDESERMILTEDGEIVPANEVGDSESRRSTSNRP